MCGNMAGNLSPVGWLVTVLYFHRRFESIKSVLPARCWPGGNMSSRRVSPFMSLDRLECSVFPQHKVEQLHCCDWVTLL